MSPIYDNETEAMKAMYYYESGSMTDSEYRIEEFYWEVEPDFITEKEMTL